MTDYEQLAKRNQRIMLGAVAIVVVMVALCFASVPLYRVFCQVTGLGGTTQRADAGPKEIPANTRTITIRFDAAVDGALPWKFKPEVPTMPLKIGEKGFTSFVATNKSDKPTRGIAVYNVTPLKVGKYFVKLQCFCFSDQPLNAHQTAHLPVIFYVDPKILADDNMKDVQEITLSYRFYPAGSRQLEDATKKLEAAPAE